MKAICNGDTACNTFADTYYGIVRDFTGQDAYPDKL